MHAIRLLCAGKLMLVSSCKTTQVVLDAPQVEKRIYVIDSAPHFPLLVLHRMHYLMHLPIPPVFRVIPAVRLKKFGQPRGRLTESCIATNHQNLPNKSDLISGITLALLSSAIVENAATLNFFKLWVPILYNAGHTVPNPAKKCEEKILDLFPKYKNCGHIDTPGSTAE